MMRNLKYTAAVAAAVLFATLPVACTDDPVEPADPAGQSEQSGDLPIRWDVVNVASSSDASRVMIGEDVTDKETDVTTTSPENFNHPDFYVTMKECCSVPKTGSREDRFAIGLFGDYTYTENGTTVTEYDFFRGDRLVYLPTEITPDDKKTPSGWDTNVAMKYWHPGAKYIFRAYYPQRLYNYTVQTSNATTLALVYPSRKLQYDLLLAVAPVDTNKDSWSGTNPVNLEFKHALAALRFQFRLNFEDVDFLTSVYLLNDEERHYFSQGTVVFGDEIDPETDKTDADILKKRRSIKWLQDYNPPADEVLYKWVPPLKYWYGEDLDGDGVIEMGGEDFDNDGTIEIGGTDLNGDGVFDKTYGIDTNGDGVNDKFELGVDTNGDGVPDTNETEEMSAEYMAAKWGWNNKTRKLNSTWRASADPDDPDVLEPIQRDPVTWDKFNPVIMYSYVEDATAKNTEDSGIGAQVIQYKSKYANSYYGTELYYDKDDKEWVSRNSATANPKEIDRLATGEADEMAAEGTPYCRNSGWLLIPPQESFGELTLCFTTKKGGRTIYKVKLPKETGSKIDAVDDDGNVIKDAAGNTVQKDAWVAGKRYTYLVTISESNYTINVSIRDWNERKHSTEIIF